MMEGCLKRGVMVVMDEGCSGCLGVALHFKDCICLSSVSSLVVGGGHADLVCVCVTGMVMYSFNRLQKWSRGFKVDRGA